MHRVGIVGVGHLGLIHLKQWLLIVGKDNVICFDTDSERLKTICDEFKVTEVENFDQLLSQVDIVDVVTPTQFHFQYAKEAIINSKHVFIEKPVCETLEEADELIDLSQKYKVKVQVGHVERFNPAYTSVKDHLTNPVFFEVHRLAPYNNRGTEVSVIMDLMIHDLDIVSLLVNDDIKSIAAKGVAILNDTPDIANVRLEYENGAVANLTASRISMKRMRKMRIFKKNMYASLNYLNKESQFFEIQDENEKNQEDGLQFIDNKGYSKKLLSKTKSNNDVNTIELELKSFVNSIDKDTKEEVTIEEARKVLEICINIEKQLKLS